MNESMALSVMAALLCVGTRALLHILDRKIFKPKNTDFLLCVFLNSLFPLIVSLGATLLMVGEFATATSFLLHPGVILSGLGAQLTAAAISLSFRSMTVKNVVVSTKVADLFIPLVVFAVASRFNFNTYCYSSASTLLFFPIARSIMKNKEQFFPKLSLLIIGALLFQCVVNSYFEMHRFGDTWPKFMSLMSCILFWRCCFVGGPLLYRWISEHKKKENDENEIHLVSLALRATLAFVSQAAFFFSITRYSSELAWPILNATPLISCFTSHLILGERVGMTELKVFGAFVLLSIFYVIYSWS